MTCLVGPLIKLTLVVAWLSIFLFSVLTCVTWLLHYLFRIIIHSHCEAPFEDFSQNVSDITVSYLLHLILFSSQSVRFEVILVSI